MYTYIMSLQYCTFLNYSTTSFLIIQLLISFNFSGWTINWELSITWTDWCSSCKDIWHIWIVSHGQNCILMRPNKPWEPSINGRGNLTSIISKMKLLILITIFMLSILWCCSTSLWWFLDWIFSLSYLIRLCAFLKGKMIIFTIWERSWYLIITNKWSSGV